MTASARVFFFAAAFGAAWLFDAAWPFEEAEAARLAGLRLAELRLEAAGAFFTFDAALLPPVVFLTELELSLAFLLVGCASPEELAFLDVAFAALEAGLVFLLTAAAGAAVFFFFFAGSAAALDREVFA